MLSFSKNQRRVFHDAHQSHDMPFGPYAMTWRELKKKQKFFLRRKRKEQENCITEENPHNKQDEAIYEETIHPTISQNRISSIRHVPLRL